MENLSEKELYLCDMFIKLMNDFEHPMIMYDFEKDLIKKALMCYKEKLQEDKDGNPK